MYDQKDCRKGKNLWPRVLALAPALSPSLRRLFTGENAKCHRAASIRLATNDSQVGEKRVTRNGKLLTKGAERIVVWAYRI